MTVFRILVSALTTLITIIEAQEAPCAQVSRRITTPSSSVPASLALQCLRSVPLQKENDLTQLRGLRLLLQFQSDLGYLQSPQPARLYPLVDIVGGIDTLQKRVEQDYYSNEYDFQADIARLINSAYDGHLSYIPDIVGTFAFIRRTEGAERYPLFSVSSDGIELPEIYGYNDRFVLAAEGGRATFDPSPIVQIDGQDVEDFLNQQAALAGSYHDPDANYNLLFPNELSPLRGTILEEFRFFNESDADETVLSFANGTVTTLGLGAVARIDMVGIEDGDKFFASCCNGTLEDLLGGRGMETVATAGSTIAMQDSAMLNVVDARPRLRFQDLEKRQLDAERPQFPAAEIESGGGQVIGYFPEANPDVAVLVISTFEVALDQVSDFQSTIGDFIQAAGEAERNRLIIDLRGNPGGLGFLAHDTFRQMFPTADPYDSVNFRAVPLFDFTGQVVSREFDGFTAGDFDSALSAPPFFSGAYPFNYRQQLNATNETFRSWSDLFGPADGQNLDRLTNLVRPNLTNILQTQFPVYPLGRSPAEASRPQAFNPEDVVLLQDGGCASTCALFSEFMKSNAPGDEHVRQVVVGGRRQTGPAQGVGGIKGGQLGLMVVLVQGVLAAVGSAMVGELTTFQADLNEDDLTAAIVALGRASTTSSGSEDLLPGGLPAGSVNFRNSIREGDSSATPLLYVYDAADCRIFYSAAMYTTQELLWQKVYEVSWEDGECIADSTGHPSAQLVTNYADIEIPASARSSFGIMISGQDTSDRSPDDGNGADNGPANNAENQGGGKSKAAVAPTPLGQILCGLAIAV